MTKTILNQFKVASVSHNANSFGLHGVIIVAKDGTAYEIGVGSLYKPKKGVVWTAEVSVGSGNIQSIHGIGFEIPTRLNKAPQEVIDAVWETKPETV